MLSQVRDALKGAIAWVVVALLILAFAMWGVPEMREFGGNSAIKVGDQSFSNTYVQREFDRTFQSRTRESGGTLTREAAIASGMPRQVVESIVNQSVIDQYAGRMNLALPRSAIRDYLQHNESFQNPATGQFDRLVLDAILQNNGLTVNAFEKIIREDLTRNQLIDALAASGPAPAAFSDTMILRQTERRRIAYLTVTDEMSGIAAEPTPDDLEQYYHENEAAFTAPEYRTFDLLMLTKESFREGLEVPEEELRKLYDAGKERLYDKPERRTIYQIAKPAESDALPATASLRQGQPFENLAEHRGMTLQAVTFNDAQKRDILDPSVADAAFVEGLEPGDVLDPVHSLFGWTVIQIAAITPATTSTFEEVRADIENDFLEQDVRRRMQDAIDELEEVRDTGAGLAEAAEAAGLTVETVGPIDRVSFAPGGAIIDKIPGEVLAEAFVIEEGEQSEATRLAVDDGYFFVSVREITPPALKPFDFVRDQVEQSWRADEQRNRISATVRSIRDAVENGETFEAAAAVYSRTPVELLIDRRFQNETISQTFNEQIFFADLNDLVSSPAGSAGAQIIAEIREIGYAPNTVTPEQEGQLRELVGYQLDQELVDAFVQSIRDDYGVKADQAQIDALFADGL